MKFKSKKFNSLFVIWLVISLVFIIPYVAGSSFLTPDVSRSVVKKSCSIPLPSVKGSLVMSIIFLCLPGILEKMHQYKEIKCQEAYCYYNAVKNNLDPKFCSAVAGYETCKFIEGEVFALPPLSFVEVLRKTMASILASPETYVYSFVIKKARLFVKQNCVSGSCNSWTTYPTLMLLIFNDFIATYTTLHDIFSNGFKSNSSIDYCSKLGKIEKEMDKILKDNG